MQRSWIHDYMCEVNLYFKKHFLTKDTNKYPDLTKHEDTFFGALQFVKKIWNCSHYYT